MKILKLLFYISLYFFTGCNIPTNDYNTSSKASDKQTFTIVNWNTQTFFDGITDGNEYSEFKTNSQWNKEKYIVRLKRLCKIMEQLDADIYVFEEIENSSVIYDISNQFAAKSWQPSQNWNYACFCKEPDSAIGCAVISRFPIYGVKQHTLDIRTQKNRQPSSRPILELTAGINEKEVLIFVNHWKSKSGGKEETEIWRDWQENILGRRLSELDCISNKVPKVICGDFNRDAEDFILDYTENKCRTTLRSIDAEKKNSSKISVLNPWFDAAFIDFSEKSAGGTYFFDEKWERIDNFFYYGALKLLDFELKNIPELCKEDGTPFIYKMYNGEGYSDHFPIMAKFLIE